MNAEQHICLDINFYNIHLFFCRKPRFIMYRCPRRSIFHNRDNRNIANRSPIKHPRVKISRAVALTNTRATTATQFMPTTMNVNIFASIAEIIFGSHIAKCIPTSNAVRGIDGPRNLKKHCMILGSPLFKLFQICNKIETKLKRKYINVLSILPWLQTMIYAGMSDKFVILTIMLPFLTN